MMGDGIKSLATAGISFVGAIAAWQEQVQFYAAMVASAVAIVSGVVSIYYSLRRKGEK